MQDILDKYGKNKIPSPELILGGIMIQLNGSSKIIINELSVNPGNRRSCAYIHV